MKAKMIAGKTKAVAADIKKGSTAIVRYAER